MFHRGINVKHKCDLISGDTRTVAKLIISIEKEVVMSVHSNCVAVLAAFFASFYTFNLKYQEEASHTLEFIQR
jgi:hypothetical protein